MLIINAIAILSEDRFLARSTVPPDTPTPRHPPPYTANGYIVGWAAQQPEQAFGSGQDVSIKGKIINLISATRMLTRSKEGFVPGMGELG